MYGLASEIFLMLFLVLDNQLLFAGSFFCPGPTGWVLHTMDGSCMRASREMSRLELYLTLKRHYCIMVIILVASLPHPRSVSQYLCLPPPLSLSRKLCSVMCCRNRGRIPFCVHQNLFWQLERSSAMGVKKGKSYRRRNTGLSEERALELS